MRPDGTLLDHHISALHGIETIPAVGFFRAARPLGADLADEEPPGPLQLDRVSLGVLDREILECDLLLAGDQEAFASGSLSLVPEAEDRFIRSLASDRDRIDIKRERRQELELARAELDDLSRFGLDQRRLGQLLGLRASIDPGHLRGARAGGLLSLAIAARLSLASRHAECDNHEEEVENRDRSQWKYSLRQALRGWNDT